MLALQIFVREWTYVCRGRVDLQFTGGRASLASQIRDGQPVSSPAYGMDIKTREWWMKQLPGMSSWQTAAWAMPIEEGGRGAFKTFEGERISLPVKSAHLPAADLVRQRRPDLAAALESPQDHVRPSSERGTFPRVVHAANKKESLVYFKRKFDADMLTVHRLAEIPHGPDGKPLSSALVSVSKGSTSDVDRGISDRRLGNWHEQDVACPRLAHASQLTRLTSRAEEGESWEHSISDLPDYFHNLSARGPHEVYNAEGTPFDAHTLRKAGITVPSDIDDAELCMCCCSTIVMGDKKAVPIAQVSHLQMLHDGGSRAEQLEYGTPVSGDDVIAGTIVDDFATFARHGSKVPDGGSVVELQKGLDGYAQQGIAPKASKLKWKQSSGVVWGGWFDGENNRVSASLDKLLELTFISLAALQHGALSPLGMQILAGGFGFCMMFRRSLFCLLHHVYDFARLPEAEVFRVLGGHVRSELLITAMCTPLMCSHLDCPFGEYLYSHDACGSGGLAFGKAKVTSASLEEMWRYIGSKEIYSSEDAEAQAFLWPEQVTPDVSHLSKIASNKFSVPFLVSKVQVFRNISCQKLHVFQGWLSAGRGLFLELWSGSAGLSQAMAEAGAEILGGVDICQLPSEDLLDLGFVEVLLQVISRGLCKLVHMGVVCTTFSIAAKPAYRFKNKEGMTQTFPNLPEHKRLKAALGDWFLHLALVVFGLQVETGGYASIENPGTSMLWHVSDLVLRANEWGLIFVAWDMCQYGAAFKKYSKLLTNLKAFQALARRCARNHVHEVLAGAVFDPKSGRWKSRTSLAAEYPVMWNREYARLACDALSFVPKGVLSSHYSDAHRVSDFCDVDLQSLARGHDSPVSHDLPPKDNGTHAKSHLNPWEEVIEEILAGLVWKTGRAWADYSGKHINILEVKAWAAMIRRLASSPSNFGHRIISVWDSKVGRAAVAKGRSSTFPLLNQFRAVLPSLLGSGIEYGGFWTPSPSMPMDGPSRGHPPPAPLPGNFRLPDREHPLVDLEELNKWKAGKWVPRKLSVAERRNARYGLRGVKLGEASKPGPFAPCGRIGPSGYGLSLLCAVSLVVYQAEAPRPRNPRTFTVPLKDTIVDVAFQRRLDAARLIFCDRFLVETPDMPSWNDLGSCDHRQVNQVLMQFVEWAFENDYTYNQAVEGLLSFAHEYFWFSLKPAWRLIRSWRDREPVELRHPINLPLLKSLIVIALCWGWEKFALMLWIGFHALLRPGELAALTAYDFVFHNRVVNGIWERVCVVRILRPKTRRLGPRRQHVLITEPILMAWIHKVTLQMKNACDGRTLTSYSAATLGKRFHACIRALNITPRLFTLAGLRPGGATWDYLNHVPIGNLKFRGRWAAESSLEHYIQECVAYLDFERLSEHSRELIARFEHLFDTLIPAHVYYTEGTSVSSAHPNPPSRCACI